MKIKALAALCSKAKTIVLYDDNTRQWVGDGCAAYLLPSAMGKLSSSALTAIFDISTEKAADMFIRSVDMPESYDTEDDGEDERELIWDENDRILHSGKDMVPLRTADGKVYLIQAKYLKPIMDSDGMRLTLRRRPNGRPYITAKDGMFLVAIIEMCQAREELSSWLYWVYNGVAKAVSYEKDTGDGELQ